jgi:hypothetical protein
MQVHKSNKARNVRFGRKRPAMPDEWMSGIASRHYSNGQALLAPFQTFQLDQVLDLLGLSAGSNAS